MELFILWAIVAGIGILIARARGRSEVEGCAWGCLLGPLGWIILLIMSPKQQQRRATTGEPLRKCPHCAEKILAEAKVCRYCHRDVEPLITNSAPGIGVEPARAPERRCGCGVRLRPQDAVNGQIVCRSCGRQWMA